MLVEALIGLGAALLLAKKQAANAAAPPSAKDVVTDEAFDSVADTVANQTDIASRNVSGYAGSITNFAGLITGQAGTGFNSVYANTGGSLDKLFGGTGGDVSAVVAESSLALIPIVALYAGLSAVPVFVVLAAFVFGAVEVVETVAKEGDHQPDALKALETKWSQIHTQTLTVLKTLYPSKTLAALERAAVPFTDGFIAQSNRIAFLRGLKGGRALHETISNWLAHGSTDWEHIDFQWQAGNFVGSYAPTPNGRAFQTFSALWPTCPNLPDVKFLNPDGGWAGGGFVPHGERTEHMVNVPPDRRGSKLTRTALPPVTAFGVSIPGSPTVYRPYDLDAQPYLDAGAFFSNAAQYSNFMSQPWGLGQTEGSTLAYGLSTGEFEGTMTPGAFSFKVASGNSLVMANGTDGHLVFQGRDVYWRDNQGKVNVMPKYTGA